MPTQSILKDICINSINCIVSFAPLCEPQLAVSPDKAEVNQHDAGLEGEKPSFERTVRLAVELCPANVVRDWWACNVFLL